MDNVYCNECRYYRGSSEGGSISCLFINRHNSILIGNTEMCHHESCFKREMNTSFVSRYPQYYKVRIQGQYQLNRNRDCKYFEKEKTVRDYIRTLINKFGSK